MYANNHGISNKVANNDIYYHYYLVKVVDSIATVLLEKYGEDPIYIKIVIPPYAEISVYDSYANEIAILRLVFNGRWMGFSKLAEYCKKYRWQVIDEAAA